MSASVTSLDDARPIVIVGAGLAGLRAGEALREAGYAGRIVLIGEEKHEPYDRPPLSKAVLVDDDYERSLSLAPQGLAKFNFDLRLGRAVVAIDRAARSVTFSDGEKLGYGRLILATGSRVRELPILPRDRARVHYVRTLDDAVKLRSALASARRVVVVGAGIIGLEVAAAAAKDREVVVLEAGPRAMARSASEPVTAHMLARHAEAGVRFAFGITVEGVTDSESGITLALSDGATLDADLVVVGIGVLPNIELARDCGLAIAEGAIVVDAHGATEDPYIFAAGEVALHYNDAVGRHLRQETWAHAAAHGAHVGRAVLAPGASYAEPSSYWTDQYEINLQAFGASIGEEDVVRGDPATGKFLVFHLVGGRVAGVSAINSVRDLRAAKKLIGQSVSARDLGDESKPLASLAAA